MFLSSANKRTLASCGQPHDVRGLGRENQSLQYWFKEVDAHALIYKIVASTQSPDFVTPNQALYVMQTNTKTTRLYILISIRTVSIIRAVGDFFDNF